MRVTNQMMNTQLLQNLRHSNERALRMQDQLATGSKIHRPGDDPVGIGYLLRYNSELERNEEFLENANTALGWLRTMDTVMNQAMKVLRGRKRWCNKDRPVHPVTKLAKRSLRKWSNCVNKWS